MPLVLEWTDLHGTGGSLSNRSKLLQQLIRPYEDFTEKKSKKLSEKLVIISRGPQERAINLGVSESRIVYIQGGADVEKIVPRPKNEVRKNLGLPLDKKIIAYTAGTHYNTDFFIKAINHIQKARKDVVLVTTGDVFENRHKEALFDPNRIIELGFLPYEKYTALLPCADVFVFPFTNSSLNTGRWPNKIGDYMAAGRPTVSNRTGDIVRLFDEHKIGFLASDNPGDFAAKTLELLANQKLSSEIGMRARQTAERHYDWRLLSKKLEACFIEVRKRHEINNEAQNLKTRYKSNE